MDLDGFVDPTAVMWLTRVLLRSPLSKVLASRQSSKQTMAPGNVYARVWAVVHATGYQGDLQIPVVWMPAHTALCQIGVATKRDGTVLSVLDRDANELADRGTRAAAIGRRVADDIRTTLLTEAREVMEMAKWIGTYSACKSLRPGRRHGHP